MMKVKYYKCHICNKKFKTLNGWGNHIQTTHPETIPEGYSISRYFYFTKTGKTHGTCRTCKGETDWNEGSMKYNQYCSNPDCKKAYVKIAKQRMIGKYGKVHLLNDPDVQRKMLENRKISGKYKFQDDQEFEYVGSYEKEFLKMMNTMLEWPSNDLMAPSPHTYYYDYKNNNDDKKNWGTKFYIPDYYIPSLNLEIEIKQSTSTNKEFNTIMRVKEKLKDDVMESNSNINYIKINDNDFTKFFEFLLKAKENIETPEEIKQDQIGSVMESYNNENVCESAKSNASNELYFVSRISMDDELLRPGIPDNYFTKSGYEDSCTPRICFAPSIDQCLMALSQNLEGMELYVHVPEDVQKVVYPTKNQVPDCEITGEVWVTKPVKLQCIGKIKVEKSFGDGVEFSYGKNSASLYKWKWKWLYKFDENHNTIVCESYKKNKCIIVSCFAGVGKNYAIEYFKKKGYTVNTIEKNRDFYAIYRNPEVDYVAHINKLSKISDILFIPYYLNMEERHLHNNVDYYLVYPNENEKITFISRFKSLNFTKEEISYLNETWDEMIEDCDSCKIPIEKKIKVDKNTFLTDVVENIILRCNNVVNENYAFESEDASVIDIFFKSKGVKNLSDFKRIKIDKKVINQYKYKIPALKSLIQFPDDSKNISFLFLDGAKYVGTCSVCPDSFYGNGWHTKEYNVIHNVEIATPYRGYSLGKQLLDFAVKELHGNAMCVYSDNEIAKVMYERYGFREVEKSKIDVASGFSDRCFMVLTDEKKSNINSTDFLPATESLFINKGVFDVHFDKFESGESNVVLITGLSGSGKTTLGTKIASKYKAELIELDMFEQCYIFENEDQLRECGEVFYQYLSSHKSLWDKLKERSIRGKELGGEIEKFLKYAIAWCKKDKTNRYVIEGVQIYGFLNKEKISGVPLLIVGTSALKSLVRRIIRAKENSKEDFRDQMKELPQCIAWYIDENKMFEKFKKSVLESFFPVEEISNESYVFSKDDIERNVDKFISGESNILLITGLSRAGKSTLGEEYADKYNAELIELDIFENPNSVVDDYNDIKKIAGDIYDMYLNKTPEGKVYRDRVYNKNENIAFDELSIQMGKTIKWVLKYCKSHPNKKYIIEGLQIYSDIDDFDSIKDLPLIIKGTSMLKCFIRRAKHKFKTLLWYIEEEKKLNQLRDANESYFDAKNESYNGFLVSYNIPRIIKTWGIVDDKGLYNKCLKVSGFDKPLRGRSEMLIIHGDKLFLALDKNGNYKIPGGGWEQNENHMDSAIRETREEVRINVKNIRPASAYITYANKPAKWVTDTIAEKDWWYGSYTEVYIGEYDSKYMGKIDEYDKDNMINIGKFYKISDVYDNLLDIHKNAISEYISRFQNNERSFMVTENNAVDNSVPVIATEGLLNIFNIFKKEKTPVPSWKETLLSPKGLFGGKIHNISSLFTGARIIDGMIEIRGINYKVLSNRIEKMYVDKSINNIFVPEYNALSYKKYEKKKIQKKQIKIDYLYTPEFFALELVCLFRDLGKRFNDKVYKSIANQIYENSWLFVADRKSEETSLLDTKNLSNISLNLEPHQLEFVQNYPKLKAQLNLTGYILAFEQGLGKTLTSAALAECLDVDHVYIVCPNSLKENWALELRKYYKKYEDDDLWKSEVFICNNKSFLFDPNVTKFVITNNESIDKMFPYVMSGKNMLILDESHNFRNINSKRVTQLLELRDKLKCSDTLIMSGTPIKATPDEIVPALMMIDPTFTMEAAKIFSKAFKLKESLGTTLVQTRFGKIMYRKDKSVLENKLPEKHVEPLLVTAGGSDKYLMENVRSVIMDRFAAIYKEGESEMRKLREPFFTLADKFARPTFEEKSRFHKIVNEFTQLLSSEIHEVDREYVTDYISRAKGNMKSNDDKKYMDFLTKNYLRYRQHCLGVAMGEILPVYRRDMFISMYNDNRDKFYKMINENTKKTLIFSQFKDVVTHIYNDLNNVGIGTVMINGDVTNRMEILQEFKENDNVIVLVATSQTIGTGVTLTEASQMFFFGPPWRQADFDQCSDRIHRIGQTDDVYIYNVILNTGNGLNLSTRMDNILQWSKKMTDAVITTTDDSEIDDVNFDDMLFASESVTTTTLDEFFMKQEENSLNIYKEVNPKLLPHLIDYYEFFNGDRSIAKEAIPENYILERESVHQPLDGEYTSESLKFSKLGLSIYNNPEKMNYNIKFDYHNDNGYEYWDLVTTREIRKGEFLSYNGNALVEN